MENEYLFSTIGFFIAYITSTFWIENSKHKDVVEVISIFYTALVIVLSVYLSIKF